VSAIETLRQVEEFLRRYANPTVRDDLRTFAIAMGLGPDHRVEGFLGTIALEAHSLDHALRVAWRKRAG
jgi:hypothetical protein